MYSSKNKVQVVSWRFMRWFTGWFFHPQPENDASEDEFSFSRGVVSGNNR